MTYRPPDDIPTLICSITDEDDIIANIGKSNMEKMYMDAKVVDTIAYMLRTAITDRSVNPRRLFHTASCAVEDLGGEATDVALASSALPDETTAGFIANAVYEMDCSPEEWAELKPMHVTVGLAKKSACLLTLTVTHPSHIQPSGRSMYRLIYNVPRKSELSLRTVYDRHTCANTHCRTVDDDPHPQLLSCSQCGIARYCSKECQRADWKKHAPRCTPPAPPRSRVRAMVQKETDGDTIALLEEPRSVDDIVQAVKELNLGWDKAAVILNPAFKDTIDRHRPSPNTPSSSHHHPQYTLAIAAYGPLIDLGTPTGREDCVAAFRKSLDRKCEPFNYTGVCLNAAAAEVCYSKARTLVGGDWKDYIGIMVIEVNADERGRGQMMRLIRTLAEIAEYMNRILLVEQVYSPRLKECIAKHPSSWKLVDLDPSSYCFIPPGL